MAGKTKKHRPGRSTVGDDILHGLRELVETIQAGGQARRAVQGPGCGNPRADIAYRRYGTRDPSAPGGESSCVRQTGRRVHHSRSGLGTRCAGPFTIGVAPAGYHRGRSGCVAVDGPARSPTSGQTGELEREGKSRGQSQRVGQIPVSQCRANRKGRESINQNLL